MKFIGDETVNSVDLNSNTYKKTGWYVLLGNSANSPVTSGLILLEVFNSDNSGKGGESISIVQKVTTLSTGLPQHYIRTSWGAWNDWRRIDNFGYNSLQELSAGVAYEIQPIMKKSIDDCNNAETGYYSFTVAPTNSPATDGGILLCIKSYPMVFQLYMSDAFGLFYRHKWYDNDWTGWQNVRS